MQARPEWFDVNRKALTVSKTATFQPKDRDERTIALTDEFAEFLKTYRPAGEYMIGEDGESDYIYRYDFRKRFKTFMKAHGLPNLTIHDMRRSFASNLVIAGVSVFKVAVWLGDGVEVVQKHYAHLLPQDDDINRGVKA